MNKVELLILESVQQSLSAIERIDIAALRGRCAAFADGHCHLDNLGMLLEHCKRYQDASHKGDAGQVMNSRRNINVYCRTMGFGPEGIDSLLKVLAGQGATPSSPPPSPPPPPPPPPPPASTSISKGRRSAYPLFAWGLGAIVACFLVGFIWILSQDPSETKPTSGPDSIAEENSAVAPRHTEKFSYGNLNLLKRNSGYFAYVEYVQSGTEDHFYYRIGHIYRSTDSLVFDIPKEEEFISEQQNKAKTESVIGEIIQMVDNTGKGIPLERIYFHRFPKTYSKELESKKVREISEEEVESFPSRAPEDLKTLPPGLWVAIELARGRDKGTRQDPPKDRRKAEHNT